MLVSARHANLLVIDMQERLLPAMVRGSETEARIITLAKAAKALDVPIYASEQYPKGLGTTVPGLRSELGNAPVFAKTAFSCWRDETIKSQLIRAHDSGRPQVVIVGIEAHVCVLQTAMDLAQAGFGVFVVKDAVSSRAPESVNLAMARLTQQGIEVVNTEMAVFELLGQAGTPEFKSLSALIR